MFQEKIRTSNIDIENRIKQILFHSSNWSNPCDTGIHEENVDPTVLRLQVSN